MTFQFLPLNKLKTNGMVKSVKDFIHIKQHIMQHNKKQKKVMLSCFHLNGHDLG